MHDFDFLFGRWSVENRRRRKPLSGSNDWYEFAGTTVEAPILGGYGNIEHYDAPDAPAPIHAVAVRLFDSKTGQWSIYWSTAGSGAFIAPTVGTFEDGIGRFYSREDFEGRPIVVRFLWTHESAAMARWEQAFSGDDGATWETNWIMNFSREEN